MEKNVLSVLPFKFPHPAKKKALTGDESRADDDVHVLTLLGKQLHLRLDELLGHYLGVAALALSRLLEVHLQRLSTQRLELLQGRGPGGGEGGGGGEPCFLSQIGRSAHTAADILK